MIGLDTNIIIHYLVVSQREHLRARKWFESEKGPFATTNTNISETLRLLTHPQVFPKPLTLDQAVPLIHSFIEKLNVRILDEAEEWWLGLPELLQFIPSLRGNEVFDAQMAITFRYHGVKELCTLDANFAKYPFLKIMKI